MSVNAFSIVNPYLRELMRIFQIRLQEFYKGDLSLILLFEKPFFLADNSNIVRLYIQPIIRIKLDLNDKLKFRFVVTCKSALR